MFHTTGRAELTQADTNGIDWVMIKRPTVCVFCGSSAGVAEVYQQSATLLGTALGQAGMDLVYGGGHVGLMGIVADAALAAGSRVTGIIPRFLDTFEVGHEGLDELVITETMHDRKKLMYERADAFVALPGGLGTFDETIEVITWTQLGLSSKPVILVNVDGYWNPFLALIRHSIDKGFTKPEHEAILRIVTTPEEAIPLVGEAPRASSPEGKWI
jgi:uncharacterized protein (TIGR00730 family)